MASVAFQSGHDHAQGPRLLDLDSGPEPPQWLQVIGSALLIVTFAALVCLWLKPVTHPDLIPQAQRSPNAFTIPVIRTMMPEERPAPESTTVRPVASSALPVRLVDAGPNTVAFAHNEDT